ncbi:hypothetical protein BFP72_14955 [Reichenbachiella sp. 5M10]|uniref:glycosyltransferase family 2 protein n=1 Tax=Reichenbachiella sp. 5M10 TaxID=1889772 RepID=UPI000C1513EC|nr:glycosyltransferase family 2 protein [Reichenbachiella sp. 5M10]PIB36607.1 hypothetical protein BFP72_14955 [Reichenbachiella sp. 5M10]
MKPLISIIVPAYNASRYIKQCLNSLLVQTYDNIEILVADDGSIDNTKSLINQYSDTRVKKYHNTTNLGVVATRNKLISLASGDYIVLQDSDDWSAPSRIEKQVAAFDQDKGLVACGTGFNKVDNKNKVLFSKVFPTDHKSILSEIPNDFPLQCPSVMFKATYLKKNPYADFFGNSGNEDLYLMGKLILNNKFINIPAPLYNYRLNDQSLTKLGQQSDLRRLYINQITVKLLTDLRETGTNWIESNDMASLNDYENSLRKKYENNPFLLHEHNIGQMLYWKQYRSALRAALTNVTENGVNPKTIRLFLYVCKQAIYRR